MRSTFFGLQVAWKGIMAQQAALDVTGHNIANANNNGYTRQIPGLSPSHPYNINGTSGNILSYGSGAEIRNLMRARDQFVDMQFRWETTQQQYWTRRENALSKMEGILNEPTTNSFRTDMERFFTAWGTLGNDPENSGSKAVVQQRALALINTMKHIDQQLTDLQNSTNASIKTQAEQINSYAEQIALLNRQIKTMEVGGASPNDLYDKRDSILDELSKLVNVRVEESQDPNFTDRKVGILKVTIGQDGAGQVLVNDGAYNTLNIAKLEADLADPDIKSGAAALTLEWNGGGALNLGDNMGALRANLDLRNNDIPTMVKEFNNLAAGIAQAVNAVYSQAGTGNFFTRPDTSEPFSMKNIQLQANIVADAKNIVAGLGSNQDGSLAKELSDLLNGWTDSTKSLPIISARLSDASSLGDYYGTLVAKLGVMKQTATRMKEGQDVLVNSMYNQREQVSGVSLDEEVTNLIRFQKSYAASARTATMMDDLLDTIVNRMGTTR